jgi:D-glycero-D-manno-heptose 1,7-bisphosphate phosphatase
MKRAIFLDRDGTLIENIPYNADPDKVKLTPFALEALHRLQAENYLLMLVSNQSGIALGYFSENDLQLVNKRIKDLLSPSRVELEATYYCMHYKEGPVTQYVKECECRKPRPGMLLQAAQEHNVDLSQSWMIGDILDDVEAGTRAGCKTILIDNGNETQWIRTRYRFPDFMARDLNQAADYIIQTNNDEQLGRV